MALPQDTTTIEEFVDAGKGITLEYFDLSFRDMISNGTWVAVLNVVNDYLTEINNASILVELTIEEQKKYFYKPKLLCFDIYGNPELYYIILLLNDMADVKEFTKPKIKMLRKDHMNIILTNIYNAELAAVRSYNSKEE